MPKVLVSTAGMGREEWLTWRRRGVGGSDAPVIAGASPYKSPLRLWAEKRGEVEEEAEPTEAAYWGAVLEPVIAAEWERRTGKKTRRRNAILHHDQYPWMLANIDRDVVGEPAILEIKTTSAWLRHAVGEDRLPDHYIIQAQHYLAVTGSERCYFAVLVGGQHLITTHVDRDDELIAQLIELEAEFWRHVEDGTPPEPGGSDDDAAILSRLYSDVDPGSVIDLPDDADALIRAYHEAKAAEREAAMRRQEAENRLKALLGDREIGRLNGRDIVIWRAITQERVDTKRLRAERPDIAAEYITTSTYRRLTIKGVDADGRED